MTTQQPETTPSCEAFAAQLQVFANAWANVGGQFDAGDGMQTADAERAIVLDMWRRLHAENEQLRAGDDAARLEIASLKAQHEGGKSEALADLAYAHGMTTGWNLCIADKHDEFARIRSMRSSQAISTIEAPQPAAQPTIVQMKDYCKQASAMMARDLTRVEGTDAARASDKAAQPAAQAQEDAGGWMRDGALLYRLTDECRPTNFDEIRVTMANGSRDIDQTSSRAERLLVMLSAPQPTPQPLHVAATSCPHEIDKDKIALHFDSKQPGKNALAQLAARLQAAHAQVVPAPGVEAVSEREFKQFLSDVLTAAGLVTHGKKCKDLGRRLGEMSMRLLTAPKTTAAPAWVGEYPAGTGNPEADRIICRLASSDPDFDDCADAVALIHKLVAEIKGPDGFDTWKDAAIADRVARMALLGPPFSPYTSPPRAMTTPLLPHQCRVVNEKADLDARATALSDFIGLNHMFNALDDAEQERLKVQNDLMWQYSEVLGARIAARADGEVDKHSPNCANTAAPIKRTVWVNLYGRQLESVCHPTEEDADKRAGPNRIGGKAYPLEIEEGAQAAPAVPDITDAYAGAQEDIAIWKKRALEAEALNHRFITDINGPTFVGEPTTSDDAFIAREFYESQDDSLLLCASDLQHSAIYDNHIEMQSCIRAVADRITALASVIEGVGRAALVALKHPAVKPDMLVNGGALKLALNVLRRAGKNEVADELECTAQAAPVDAASRPLTDSQIAGIYFEALGQHLREQDRKTVTRFARAIEAATAPQPAAQAQNAWNPIETAPKDKSNVVLLRQPCGSVANGYFLAEAHAGNGAWIWPYIHKTPTHWMPLPAPPATIAAKQGGQ